MGSAADAVRDDAKPQKYPLKQQGVLKVTYSLRRGSFAALFTALAIAGTAVAQQQPSQQLPPQQPLRTAALRHSPAALLNLAPLRAAHHTTRQASIRAR